MYSGLQLTFLSIFRRGGGKFQVADPTVVVGSPDPEFEKVRIRVFFSKKSRIRNLKGSNPGFNEVLSED